MASVSQEFTLGLDLGSASLGWAIIEKNQRLVDCGVRIFDPGVNSAQFDRGEEGSSNNVIRRTARLHRRQLRRRAGRQRELFRVLQLNGLFPQAAEAASSTERHRIIEQLDGSLRDQHAEEMVASGTPEQWLVYWLRKRGLDRPLEPHELGRVLYHLSQRRGYKSNRKEKPAATREGKADKKKAEELGKVLAGIAELEKTMDATGARTLAEYFCGLNPEEAKTAPHIIRNVYTPRKLYLQEFELLWAAQAQHRPEVLTPELKGRVHTLLFFQRPLAANDNLVGMCELEKGKHRARVASLEAQEFRVLQKVNDLRYSIAGSEEIELSREQRGTVYESLQKDGDRTFPQLKKLLGLSREASFNLERGGEKRLRGNRTLSTMIRVFGAEWDEFEAVKRERIIRLWLIAEDEESLKQSLRNECGITEEQAAGLAVTAPEDGYSRLCLEALRKLLPGMREGQAFKTVEARIYGTAFSGGAAFNYLPPAKDILPQIPNPAVTRALAELRKVVNAIIRTYGKPVEVRIELARELKRNAKQRQRMSEDMRNQEKSRIKAKERILKEAGIPSPSRTDIQKALLYEECKGICIYCGRPFGFSDMYSGEIDIDHILPRNRFPDDSFSNKLLAHRHCNHKKLGRTPFEVFGSDAEEWARMLAEIKRWKNETKAERFQIADSSELDPAREDSFAARRLNDTRYVTKLAARYLGCLYGGRDEAKNGSSRRVIFASSGLATATLRKAWGLEAVLGRPKEERIPGKKPRLDHRHHAVDAAVVALTSNAVIQQLGQALSVGVAAGAERVAPHALQSPWPDFVLSIAPQIKNMKVSHRPSHRLKGALHDETNYSRPLQSGDGKAKKHEFHVRKPVHLLTEKQIPDIVDPAVRNAVAEKVKELGGEPKNLEKSPAVLVTRRGKRVPIFRARIRIKGKPVAIASAERQRYVMSGGNHHVPIFEVTRKGKKIWDTTGVVTRLEAAQRMRKSPKYIIQKELPKGEEGKFLFSLMSGDVVEMDDAQTKGRNFFVARTVSDADLTFVRHTEARQLKELKKGPDTQAELIRLQGSWDKLRQWNCRKVFVDVLGRAKGEWSGS